MSREVKWTLTIVTLVVCTFVGNAAATICFKFNELSSGSGQAEIEAYMEGIYGSDITVLNTAVGDGSGALGPDSYLQNKPSNGKQWLTISFNEVPITAVSFDWAMEGNLFQAFAAYVGDDDDDLEFVEFLKRHKHDGSSGNMGMFYFDSPVKVLKFTDTHQGEIQLDNLCVKPIPEPATIALLGLGAALSFISRRRISA